MFYGRKETLDDLARLWKKSGASLVTVRGRRRIGKSTLVEEFAKESDARFIKLEGKAPERRMTNDEQLKSFCSQLKRMTKSKRLSASDWSEAFALLDDVLDNRRTVVLLDEISWMGKYAVGFSGDLKIAWDNLWCKHPHTIVFICGSVSAWITKNILDSTGFVGRRAMDIVLEELPLVDCIKFWRRKADKVSIRDVIDVLSVTGGVPKYLEEIDPALSADENIRRMCFGKSGILSNDFDETFSDVFEGESSSRREILESLSSGPRNVSEIAEALGKERNGHLSEALDDLVLSGFVAKDDGFNPKTGAPTRESRYRLKDNYARFYLKYIRPRKALIAKDGFRFAALEQLDGWDTILGLQFENLILNHVVDLLPHLGLDRTLLTSASPYRRSSRGKGEGVQIDLLILSKRFRYIVEIKRRDTIGREVISEVERKVSLLPTMKGISTRTALVYEGNLSKAVEGDGFFDAIVPVATVLGRR